MRLALGLLVQNPTLGPLAREGAVTIEALAEQPVRGVELLAEVVELCCRRPNLSTAQLLENLRSHDAHEHLVKLAIWDLPGDDDQRSLEFLDALVGIRLQRVDADLADLPRRIVDQDAEQRARFRDLQEEKKRLRETLRGRNN
jgi:hypothetical protein